MREEEVSNYSDLRLSVTSRGRNSDQAMLEWVSNYSDLRLSVTRQGFFLADAESFYRFQLFRFEVIGNRAT